MDADTARRLNELAGQLAEALMTAGICAQEIQAAVRTEIGEVDLGHRPGGLVPRPPNPVDHPHPIIDQSRFTVTLGVRGFWRSTSQRAKSRRVARGPLKFIGGRTARVPGSTGAPLRVKSPPR